MITNFNPDKLLLQLQTILVSDSNDLNQLCKQFFEQVTTISSTDLQGLELLFLQTKTGSSSSSIPDLWKTYLLQLGYSEYPFDAFYNFAIIQDALSLFSAFLLEDGSYLLLENGGKLLLETE